MDLHSLLTDLANKGIKLSANAGLLEVDAPKGAITPELRNLLAEYKAELLLLLRQNMMSASSTSLSAIAPALEQRYEPFPLTDMQHAFWVGRSGVLELGNVANHGYYEIECKGLDLERLNWALQKLIERHDMLRAIVLPDGQQQILEQVPPYQIEVLDLTGQEDEAVTSQIEAIRQRMSHQVLPANRWPLFEFQATRLDGQNVRLHFSYDLQIFDAWSMFRFFDEWFQLYQHPESSLPSLELSFRDYVLAEQALQETELYKRSQEYWTHRLDNFPSAPDLPLAKTTSQLKQHLCQRYSGHLDRRLWQQLKQRTAEAGLTPSGVLLAAFVEVLTLWSKNPRFTISLALFNRLPLHPQVNDILGDFTSVTLLAVDNSARESFSDRAVRLQQQLWQDLEHRYFSGVRVMRELSRREGRVPNAIPVVFTSTLGFGSLGQEASAFSNFGEVVYGISQASQVWMDHQVWEEKGLLKFNWDVVEELFPEGLVKEMFEAYCRLLNQLATIDVAWSAYDPLLLPSAQSVQRDAVNATAAHVSNEMLHTLFAAQVHQRSQELAVISSGRTLTYQELFELSNQVGHWLRRLGSCRGLVAVVMEKGWEQIVAVLGILASGAAYVPIDPNLPQERINYLLENSEAKIILTQSWLNENLAWVEEIQRLCIDSAELDLESKEPLEPIQTADNLAYVIYTSGSTGLPKGVMITHRNVVNVVVHTNKRFKVSPQDRILALTALNHDLSAYDIFGLLSAGGTIVMPDASAVKDPAHWTELMVRENVTLWNSVPAMMEMLVSYVEEAARCGASSVLESQSVARRLEGTGVETRQSLTTGNPLAVLAPQVEQLGLANCPPRYRDCREISRALPASLRLAILGGDWLPVSLPTRLRALVPNVQILSIGGPTETTIWNIGYLINKVDPNWKSIPYGRPMANSKYYILNEALDDCPVWVPGQMYCAGVQLAKGYWHNQEKTRENFITHPRTGERIYCTGDLGRYLPDGNIEFLGREDFQLKLRGYRIEAGEIEAALKQHPAVKDVVVTAVEALRDGSDYNGLPHLPSQSQGRHLVAYVIPEPGEASSLFETESADSAKSQQLWKSLVQAGHQQAQQTFWDLDLQTFSAIWKYQDYVYTVSVCWTLRKLGVYNSAGEKYDIDDLISRCQIAPRYRKWLERALKVLAQEGWLQQKGQVFESLVELPTVVCDRLSTEIQTKLAQRQGFTKKWLDLLPLAPSENLAEIITENIHSAEIYASQKTQALYQIMFADCNAIATEIIKAVVQALEPGKQLRILEVGAGYGSTTVNLLPLLPPERTTYTFTDISNFFLQKAQENFTEYSFVHYDLLDLEKNPHEQGYEPHTFDIIIAATVLHNTRSIEESLKHIRSLLAPNGLFLAIEKTQFHRLFDLNMGLQQGFERFEDEHLRQDHPLLSKEQWQRTLFDLGFEDSVWMNQPDSVADFIGFDVFVAQGSSSVKQFKPKQLRNFLHKKLPDYMVPSDFKLLDALPLTVNGKVDRLALSGLKGHSEQLSAAYAMPQTETEQFIASVWQEILRIEKVGIHDNFFELGGDSLQVTQVASRLREQFKINLSVQSLFESPTLNSLAESIEQIQRITQKLQAPIDRALTNRLEIEL